jgi:V/A-type H+-transporting ATPase subunit B
MEAPQLFTRQTKAISTARRSLLMIESIPGIRFNEIVEVELGTGEMRRGQVSEV